MVMRPAEGQFASSPQFAGQNRRFRNYLRNPVNVLVRQFASSPVTQATIRCKTPGQASSPVRPPIGGARTGELTASEQGGGELNHTNPGASNLCRRDVYPAGLTVDRMSTTKRSHRYWQAADFFAVGRPAPQGSKSFKGIRNGKAILTESSKNVAPWRAAVTEAAKSEWHGKPSLAQSIGVDLMFILPRPKSLPKSKPTPDATKRNGDIDKLARAVLDSLTDAGLWHDDAQVIYLNAAKRIAEEDEPTGARIVVMVREAA